MIEYPIVELSSIIEALPSSASFKNEIMVSVVNSQTEFLHSCMRIDALQIILVQEGSLEVQIDYKPYNITANTIIIVMPTHIVQSIRVSPDFKCFMLAASRSFLERPDPIHDSPEIVYMKIRKNPIIQCTKGEMKLLEKCLNILQDNIKLTSHKLQRMLLINNLQNFLIELANIFYQQEEYFAPPTLSRKEELFSAFLRLLIANCRKEHAVSFYSEKLFITPQYLSLILKEQTGKSANKWIDDVLIQEAKILLKAPQATVQQVADLLHFSDQSTFGKFFKKHVGISPMEYRKSC